MKKGLEIADDIYWIGVKDDSSTIFENLWPLDNGITYNAYLCVDEQITLIDCVENDKVEELLQKHHEILPENGEIDFLIINHIEPDHSGGITKLIEAYPNIKIVGNKATFKFLEGYYHIHDNLFEVKNNTVLKTGKHSFRFISTPMLHWPETMMTFHETSKILFSGDAFGSFGHTREIFDARPFEEYKGEFIRYFSNVLGKYNKNILKALSRIEPLQPEIIASTHGPVWKQHLNEVISLYYKFAQHLTEPKVMVLYGSMYGNTEKLARHIYQSLEEKGVQVSLFDVS
ncbi:MAG: MBL fold metallo-hydrolase, partial [Bacteroidetes bacterium]|nr:MBL fold metallo-hydrolase [Bacteroidota bacterium]